MKLDAEKPSIRPCEQADPEVSLTSCQRKGNFQIKFQTMKSLVIPTRDCDHIVWNCLSPRRKLEIKGPIQGGNLQGLRQTMPPNVLCMMKHHNIRRMLLKKGPV